MILAVLLVAECSLAVRMWQLQVLPGKYYILLVIGLVLVAGLLSLLLFVHPGKWQKKVGHGKQIAGYILALIVAAGCLVGTYAVTKLEQTVDAITQPNTVSTYYGVYVLAEDGAQSIEDAAGYSFAVNDATDPENTALAVSEIGELAGAALKVQNFATINELIDGLYNQDVQAIILNQSYVDILVEVDEYADFTTRTKLLYEHSIVHEVEATEPPVQEDEEDSKAPVEQVEELDPTTMPFIVYLSGSDTRSSTLVKSRSDVNILAAVNPVTKQILLINTPRDYWVSNPAGNGAKDKLTHCGLYGQENSMGALEDLYGQPVTYYAQINFTGFRTLIDAIGGVTVYSDVSFYASEGEFTVHQGSNTLNGKQALAFARERKNLAGGDNARGRNQMKLIAAVVDKLTSGALIKNYSDILDSLQGMFVTNMSSEEISDLIKMQLEDMASWDVLSYAVTGSNGSDTNYSMPGLYSYVMYPDEEMVSHASDLMGRLLNGETLTEEDLTVG